MILSPGSQNLCPVSLFLHSIATSSVPKSCPSFLCCAIPGSPPSASGIVLLIQPSSPGAQPWQYPQLLPGFQAFPLCEHRPAHRLIPLVLSGGCLALLPNPQWLPITCLHGRQIPQPLVLASRDLLHSSLSSLSLTALQQKALPPAPPSDPRLPLHEFYSSVTQKRLFATHHS